MTWNYRIVKHDDSYSLHEVYYDDNSKPCSMTVEPCDFGGDDPQEVMKSLVSALDDCLRLPVFEAPKEWRQKPGTDVVRQIEAAQKENANG